MLGQVNLRRRGLTITEMLITVAIVAIALTVVAPSFTGLIEVQRLKGVTAQLVTDVQYARNEAAARGKQIIVTFKTPGAGYGDSCYTIYSQQAFIFNVFAPIVVGCDCSAAPGARCVAGTTEIKTVQIPADSKVALSLPATQNPYFILDPTTGGMASSVIDVPGLAVSQFAVNAALDTRRTLSTVVGLTGRPTVCQPSGSSVSGGYPAC